MFVPVRGYCGTNLSVTLKQAENQSLAPTAIVHGLDLAGGVPVHVLAFTHLRRFRLLRFHLRSKPMGSNAIALRTMEHKPCGFLGDAKVSLDLVRANPIAATANHPHSTEPFVKTYCRVLENRPHFDGVTLRAIPPRLKRASALKEAQTQIDSETQNGVVRAKPNAHSRGGACRVSTGRRSRRCWTNSHVIAAWA